MSNIIKRRKTTQYTQINNHPVQKDLGNLSAIGLLTYIMSLPEDWILHKTHLQNTFTRRTVDSAWKILVEKKYAVGFYGHISGKKNYSYMVSDIPFTEIDYNDFVKDSIQLFQDNGETVYNVMPIMDSPYEIPYEISIVHNVQYTAECSDRTYTKELKTKETLTKKQLLSIVNKQSKLMDNNLSEIPKPAIKENPEIVLTDLCNEFYAEFSAGRWNKKTWKDLVDIYVSETIENNRFDNVEPAKRKAYVFASLRTIANNHDLKIEQKEIFEMYAETEAEAQLETALEDITEPTRKVKTVPFYNWLEERS